MAVLKIKSLVGLLAWGLCLPVATFAQTTDITSLRAPESGPPVLDCNLPSFFPEGHCAIRLPAGAELVDVVGAPANDLTEETRIRTTNISRFESEAISDQLFGAVFLVDTTPGVGSPNRLATFEAERQAISDFAIMLGESGVSTALQYFSDEVRQVLDFGRHSAFTLENELQSLSLSGRQTHLASAVETAIDTIAAEPFWLKTVFVFSDGAEEGIPRAQDIGDYAFDRGVEIRSVAMMWEPVSDPSVSRQNNYLATMSQRSGGSHRQIDLRAGRDSIENQLDEASLEALSDVLDPEFIAAPEATEDTLVTVTLRQPSSAARNAPMVERDYSAILRVNASDASGGESEATAGEEANTEEEATTEEEAKEATNEAAAPEGEGWFAAMRDFAERNSTVILAILIGLAILGLILALVLKQRSVIRLMGAQSAAGGEHTPPMAPGSPGHMQPTSHYTPAEPVRTTRGKMMGVLAMSGSNERVPIFGPNALIGRSTNANVRIPNQSVSRQHARITQTADGRVMLMDLNSTNGTHINNAKCHNAQPIESGTRLRFGDVEAVFLREALK